MELEETSFSTVTPQELLGRPLNDVETKFAPKRLYIVGPLEIPLPRRRVSIVGSRKASSNGIKTASGIAKSLVNRDVTIVSGLAEGIDTAAHESAISAGGKTVAVLGTPLNKVFPAKNFDLQQRIMCNHLAISQFPIGHQTYPGDFITRNRTMALIADATIIVEAGEGSGSHHQGWEALRLGRPLFIWTTIVNDRNLKWPVKMLDYGAIELADADDVLEILPSSAEMLNVFQ